MNEYQIEVGEPGDVWAVLHRAVSQAEAEAYAARVLSRNAKVTLVATNARAPRWAR